MRRGRGLLIAFSSRKMIKNIVKYPCLEKVAEAGNLSSKVVFSKFKFYDGKGPRGCFGWLLSLDKKYRRDDCEGFFYVFYV